MIHYIESSNKRNESHIEFMSDESLNYQSANDFYKVAIMKSWQGWDSEKSAILYIEGSIKKKRTIKELNNEITTCLKSTPVPEFNPNTIGASEIYSFYDEWNNKEFLWKCDGLYWLMSWGTAS